MDLHVTLSGASECRANMPFHTIRFDELGNPLVPEGVDAAEWQMELPSILGLAWTGCRDSDTEVASEESSAASPAHSCEGGLSCGCVCGQCLSYGL